MSNELVLSATDPEHPLTSLTLTQLETGTSVFNFKTSTSTDVKKKESNDENDGLFSIHRKPRTVAYLPTSSGGSAGFIAMLNGHHSRAAIYIYRFQSEQIYQRIIPSVKVSTLNLSHNGLYLAAGSFDGRIFLWEVATGHLITVFDAHFRAISTIEFTADDEALVSGSQDASVHVWSISSIVNSTAQQPPSPLASLSDHTLPVTGVQIGAGIFPFCRILTASVDNTCKLWDISGMVPSLLVTYNLPGPVVHVALDILERFFFAVCPGTQSASSLHDTTSTVYKIDLYKQENRTAEFRGGSGLGDFQQIEADASHYHSTETVTALSLSTISNTLLLGTSSSKIVVLSLPALISTRVIAPPAVSATLPAVTFIATLNRPPDLANNDKDTIVLPTKTLMGSNDASSGSSSAAQLGRTSKNPGDWLLGGPNGRVVHTRITAQKSALELLNPFVPKVEVTVQTAAPVHGTSQVEALQDQLKEANGEVETLKQQLARAVALNEAMWKKLNK